jgi:hypothetical protein
VRWQRLTNAAALSCGIGREQECERTERADQSAESFHWVFFSFAGNTGWDRANLVCRRGRNEEVVKPEVKIW